MARFLDANVPMYSSGAEHPLRESCIRVLIAAARDSRGFVTSVEVLQELIHRYLSERRWQRLGRILFDEFSSLMAGRIEPVVPVDASVAASLADRYPGAQSRDLFHVAVMRRLGITEIISTDRGFDAIPEVTRIDPADWSPSQ